MNRLFKAILLISLLSISACNKSIIETTDTGNLSLDLGYDGKFSTKAGEINTDEFVINITRPYDSWSTHFNRFADMPKSLSLGSGQYIISACSPNTAPAAWDQPIYSGSTDFAITTGNTTPVQLTCILSNMKVTIEPTANFLSELSVYSVTISNGLGSLIWTTEDIQNGGKEGYFTVAPLSIHVEGYRAIDNSHATYDTVLTNVMAQDHHVISLNAQVTGALGGINIFVDTTTKRKDEEVKVPGFIEVPVDPGNPEQPEGPEEPEQPTYTLGLTWAANPQLERVELRSEGMVESQMTISSSEGLQEFRVIIESPTETFMATVSLMATRMEGGKAILDLMDESTLTIRNDVLGLGTDSLEGAKEISLDLGNLLPLIIGFDPELNSVHKFTMDLKDKEGHTYTKTLEFEYKGN